MAEAGIDQAAATGVAVARWMGWRIDRRIERQHGIPRGLPYLTGFVTFHEIEGQTQLRLNMGSRSNSPAILRKWSQSQTTLKAKRNMPPSIRGRRVR